MYEVTPNSHTIKSQTFMLIFYFWNTWKFISYPVQVHSIFTPNSSLPTHSSGLSWPKSSHLLYSVPCLN